MRRGFRSTFDEAAGFRHPTLRHPLASAEEAIRRSTRNVSLITTLSYGFGDNWSATLRLPVVKREHVHDLVEEQSGLPSVTERWDFTRLGDVQFIGSNGIQLVPRLAWSVGWTADF